MDKVEVKGRAEARAEGVLTTEALGFVAELQRAFDARRRSLLEKRAERQRALDAGATFGFPEETRDVRAGEWKVPPAPRDLRDRRVEITGPVDRKMMINALNSGAKVFMADFEDSLAPTWSNVVSGQANLQDAVRRTLEFRNPDGRVYRLDPELATLVVRPRGWHLVEKHVLVDGAPVSASLLDFGLYLFHNHRELRARGTGPYYYLPKLEGREEARLWADVFRASEDRLGLARGTVRATVLIETLPAAFEMDEILWELRDHALGLNAGRWDYIFSLIKRLRTRSDAVLPDRAAVTMTVPFMRAYTELLVRTCHRRGAHAMGGMSAFVPNRRDAEVTERALRKVREDKEREAGDGFDGTWVAHPDLVPVAMEVFDRALGDRPNQLHRSRDDVRVAPEDLLRLAVPDGKVTEAGLRNNVEVAMLYIAAWLRGTGAVAIHDLMEDAATAEISRSQLWQWVRHGARLDGGATVTADLVRSVLKEELERVRERAGDAGYREGRYAEAAALLERVALDAEFAEFLTIPAYEQLD